MKNQEQTILPRIRIILKEKRKNRMLDVLFNG